MWFCTMQLQLASCKMQQAGRRYAVVEFLKEASVAVVASSWLKKGSNDIQYCFWPPFSQTAKAKKRETPDKERWMKFRVRIFQYADTYTQAVQRAKDYMFVSNVEEEEEDTRRPSKKPRRYDEHDVADDEDEDSQVEIEDRAPVHLPKPPKILQARKDAQEPSSSSVRGRTTTSSGDRPHVEKRPTTTASADQPRMAPSEKRPTTTASADRPRVAPSEKRPTTTTYGDRPRVAPSEKRPTTTASTDQPRIAPSEKRPTTTASTDQPRVAPFKPTTASLDPAHPFREGQMPSYSSLSSEASETMTGEFDFSAGDLSLGPEPSALPLSSTPRATTDVIARQRVLTPSSPSSAGSAENAGFQRNVLMRLKVIEEQVAAIYGFMQAQASANIAEEGDPLPTPSESIQDLEEFCNSLEEPQFYKTMSGHLDCFRGRTLSDTTRRVMAKIATNSLWSSFSLKGRKGKLSFLNLPCARLVIKTCKRNHPTTTLGDIELELQEYLKHAPKRVGGSKYQLPASKRTIQDCLGEDEDH